MSTLWSFGDSFTYNGGWGYEYKKWKGYHPKSHSQLLSKRLQLKLNNFAYPGYSNDMIFDTICDNIKDIKENDIVNIGWVSQERFRLGSKDGKWVRILPKFTKDEMKLDGDLGDLSQNTIDELLINRSNPVYKVELLKRIELINYILPKTRIVHWSWSYPNKEMEKFETVYEETNGLINDFHWSEKGQLDFTNWFIKIIDSNVMHHNDIIKLI